MSSILFGGNLSLSFGNRGPTYTNSKLSQHRKTHNLKAQESEKQGSRPALPRRGASSIAKEMSNIPKANLKAQESEKQACIAKK
jgi:hypothetical protein